MPRTLRNDNDNEAEELTDKPVAKKRGRPPKQRDTKDICIDEDCVPPKLYKFLGYCSNGSCSAMICDKDLDTKTITVCSICGDRSRVSNLKQSRDTGKFIATSKSEFLSNQNLNVE